MYGVSGNAVQAKKIQHFNSTPTAAERLMSVNSMGRVTISIHLKNYVSC